MSSQEWDGERGQVKRARRYAPARPSPAALRYFHSGAEQWPRYAVPYHEYLACEVDRVETGPRCHGCRTSFFYFSFLLRAISLFLLLSHVHGSASTGMTNTPRAIYRGRYRYFDWIGTICVWSCNKRLTNVCWRNLVGSTCRWKWSLVGYFNDFGIYLCLIAR